MSSDPTIIFPEHCPYANELRVAAKLAKQASAVVLRHYNQTTPMVVDYKDEAASDPVTAADKDANTLIVNGLKLAFPQDAILAEESPDNANRLSHDRLWCVDPVDGTREYVARNGQFVVMIGLAISGHSVLGVVLQPTTETMWYGVIPYTAATKDGRRDTGGYAFRQSGNHNAVPISVSTKDDPATAKLMVSRSHRSEAVMAIAKSLGGLEQIPMGSVGLKAAALCSSTINVQNSPFPDADLYISLTDRTKEWDSCAPEAILRGAGGTMTGINGDTLRYNKPEPNNRRGILASNGHLHAAALKALQPVTEHRGWG